MWWQVRELPHSVYAVGTLEGMVLMLQSLVYRHPGVSNARDEVRVVFMLELRFAPVEGSRSLPPPRWSRGWNPP